jgi:DNA-binding protein H-NS
MQLMAAAAFRALGQETAPAVAAIWGWDSKTRSVPPDALDELSADQCALLMLDAALAADCWVSSWSTGKPLNLQAAAARYDVDAAAVRKEIQATKKHAKSAKPAASAKTGKKSGTPPVAHPERVKYRHPDTDETWSGRGKPPAWITKAEAEGRPRSEFLTVAPARAESQASPEAIASATSEHQDAPENATSTQGEPGFAFGQGDRVRVKADARGPNGKHMKVCGRVGTVRLCAFGVVQVDFDDGSSHMQLQVKDLERLDITGATDETSASAEPEGHATDTVAQEAA